MTAQKNTDPVATVHKLFDAMRNGDSTTLASCFHPKARLMTVGQKREGRPMTQSTPVAEFVRMVGSPHEQVFNEEIYDLEFKVDGRLATVWAPYTFYLDDELSHCGTNAFQLFYDDVSWKILQITDTRFRKDCTIPPVKLIHKLMDDWHHAAAVADEDIFFGSMTEDGIYLGTDDSERWVRDEMAEWSKPYFEKESAWAFTAKDREIYFADDGNTAWFEERLDTWMGPCRGSGVVRLTDDGWKIAHYNLAITVPNDKIDGFLKLIGKERKSKE